MSLITLLDKFNCDDKCREYLEDLRWPDGIECPQCGNKEVKPIKDREKWHCLECGYHFSVTSGTVMHDTHLPLRKWFAAVYLLCQSKKGMSAHQLHRTIGVAYRTAWYLSHRIREAMGRDVFSGPTLFGVVEVDETLIRGKTKGNGRGYRGNKSWVAGAIQRGGKVRVEHIPDVTRKTLHGFIAKTIKDEAEAIYTDELKSYLGIEDHNPRHETVRHSIDEWVVGDVHTNSIEGVWSLFKRSIVGSFHKVSKKHLGRYLEEIEWKFNNRKNPHIFRDTLKQIVEAKRMPYKRLVS